MILPTQYMVQHIMQQNRRPDGWKKRRTSRYGAARALGFDKQFSLEAWCTA
jgi:hypothetical protein